MRKFVLAIGGLTLATLASCDSVTPPDVRAVSGTSASLQGALVRSTNGEGQSELPPGFGLADFVFSVHEKSDGTVRGEFSMFRIRNGLTSDFDGIVTCVSSDPLTNRAWVGGVITANRSTDPGQQTAIHQPGRDVWFRLVDNGEGSEAAADRITVLGFEGAAGIITSAQYCATKPWLAADANTFPVVSGNIQVRQ
jgi:hypothetical protein